MDNPLENDEKDKRHFPRVDADCPVQYLLETSIHWKAGTLINLSATGLLMFTEEPLSENTTLFVSLKPERDRAVPALTGEARVLRCTTSEQGRYEVACKFLHIDIPGAS